ncbi:MAG: sulfur carrier protein ThiS [Janthinobacterium lividum]
MPITITLNGEPRALDGPVTVAGLVRALSLDGRKIAVERNREIVPRGRYDAVELGQGDRLEIVHFIGGG